MSRPALGGGSCNWEARSDASATEAAGEKELLQAIRRYGETTAAALETSLSEEGADRMLSVLTVRGHSRSASSTAGWCTPLWGSVALSYKGFGAPAGPRAYGAVVA